ncbi:MAG: sugar ABC transporter ATP-binding protein [Fimbriimonas sp.]
MLEARGITKRYPGVTALDDVDFSVAPGEVVALIGENGAGKSTMIKVLGGLVSPDAGEVRVDGQPVTLHSAADATRLGIGLIHQELNNLDNLDVAANVFLGREPRKYGILIDRAAMARQTQIYLEQLGLDVSADTPLADLSIARQQMVEIAKALSLNAKYLIMDEPTSSLTAGETRRLLRVVRQLASQGVGIVYVSHRLGEVEEIADRAVAFRDGKNAGKLDKDELFAPNMVRLMVGRDIERQTAREQVERTPRVVVRGLRTARFPDHEVSFEIGRGEIVGMAGLVGAGRSEVARTLFGADRRVAGTVEIDGETVPAGSPQLAIEHGLYLAPEDRRSTGVITSLSIRENISLPSLGQVSSSGLVRKREEAKLAEEMKGRLGVKAPTVETPVRGLSGGNQQKVVLAKWIARNPRCMIFDEPTRGIDVGARSEIYDLMRRLADDGVAILMISSDMEEVLGMSDRVLVMHEGRLAGSLSQREATEESVMKLAVGDA